MPPGTCFCVVELSIVLMNIDFVLISEGVNECVGIRSRKSKGSKTNQVAFYASARCPFTSNAFKSCPGKGIQMQEKWINRSHEQILSFKKEDT